MSSINMNTILLSQKLTNILWKEAFFGTDTVRYRFSFKALSPSYTWKTSTKIHIITVTGKLKICSNRYTVTLKVHFNITYSAMNRCKLIIYFNIFMKFNIVVLKLAKLLCIISERWNRKFGIMFSPFKILQSILINIYHKHVHQDDDIYVG